MQYAGQRNAAAVNDQCRHADQIGREGADRMKDAGRCHLAIGLHAGR